MLEVGYSGEDKEYRKPGSEQNDYLWAKHMEKAL